MNIITIPKYNNKIKGKKCVVCGESAFAHLNGLPYCRRHYMQMRRGGIKERTTRDPNELVDLGPSTKIILYNKKGIKINQYGLIDSEDVDLVQGKRIGFGKFGEKEYCYINTSGKPVLLHRFIWTQKNGEIPQDKVVDHINGNGLDCRKGNLRLASAKENSYNLSKSNKYTGVNPYGDRFNARIMHNRIDHNLGTFPTLKEALDARINAERKFFGEFGPNISRIERGLLNYSRQQNFTQEDKQYGRSDVMLGLFPNSYRDVFLPYVYFDSVQKQKGNTGFLNEAFVNPAKGTLDVVNSYVDDVYGKASRTDASLIRARIESILGKDYFKDSDDVDSRLSRVVSSNLRLNDLRKLEASRLAEGALTATGVAGAVRSVGTKMAKKMIVPTLSKVGTPVAIDVALGEYDNKKSEEMLSDFERDLLNPNNKKYVSEGASNGFWGDIDPSKITDEDFKKYIEFISYEDQDRDFIEKIKKDLKSSKPKESKNTETIVSKKNNTSTPDNLKQPNIAPLMLAGLALGGAYLWKKNKEEKEKKKNARKTNIDK